MKEEIKEYVEREKRKKEIRKNLSLDEDMELLIDELVSQPWLGNATTRELLEELTTRIELDGPLEYRTSDRHGEVRAVSE